MDPLTNPLTNPYASHLANRDPFPVIAATARELAMRTSSLTTEAANRPTAPGKWSIRQIVCHLADTEIAFAFRIRQALAEPHHVIQPFDQQNWAERYDAYGLPEALEAFSAMRRWNLLLLNSLASKDFESPLTHPERGAMTLRTLVETMAGHDINHLSQLK